MKKYAHMGGTQTKIQPILIIFVMALKTLVNFKGSCHKRQKPQSPTPQAPIRNRQTRKVANAKGLNCNTNLT